LDIALSLGNYSLTRLHHTTVHIYFASSTVTFFAAVGNLDSSGGSNLADLLANNSFYLLAIDSHFGVVGSLGIGKKERE